MLYTLHLMIENQKSVTGTAEHRKQMIGFCLQALEVSRHRLFELGDSITQCEQDWLHKLETSIVDFLHNSEDDDAEDAVVMYVDAFKTVGVTFYGGAYPLVLTDVLCYLCTKNERLKTSLRHDLVKICAEILLSVKICLNQLTLTVGL